MRRGAGVPAVLALALLAPPARAEPLACRAGTKPFARAELFFGTGANVPAPAWRRFLAGVVTPRFPDGFTVLDGQGQWRGPKGITREASHVLIVLYPPDVDKDRALDDIRAAYKRQFKQQSVLRVDSAVCAAF